MAEQTVELQPSEAKLVSFEAVPQQAKTYSVSVDGLSGSFIAIKVPTRVTIRWKNSPSGANRWGLCIENWSQTKESLCDTILTIDDEAVFDIPPDWDFPLRFGMGIYYYYAPTNSVTMLYRAQSRDTRFPNYVEEFIPDYGSYYFNVATEKFEPR